MIDWRSRVYKLLSAVAAEMYFLIIKQTLITFVRLVYIASVNISVLKFDTHKKLGDVL